MNWCVVCQPHPTLKAVRPSDFVEFEATLQRNQFLVQLSAVAELVPIMSVFEEPTVSKASRSRKQNKEHELCDA